ncbi:MAG TPA: nucleotidyltransferase family protein [Thermoanaerobaculia bacterium]|nr:nucleotidyltransferase family protein [Thermoanaerobaculia bacterium]
MKRLAAALSGDRDALAALAADPAAAELARVHRVAPALSLRARRLGIGGPAAESWHRALIAVTAHRLHIEDRLGTVGAALGEAGVPWLPLKGCDLGARVYGHPEERPVGDIDLLVPRADLPRVQAALRAIGWRGLAESPRQERYLRDEGYAWQAQDAAGVLLEVHVRLWGIVPAGLGAALLAAAVPDPALGSSGRRLPLAHAWLVAAVHSWLNPPPRPLLSWWDLERIAAAEPGMADLAENAVRLAEAWDLQLPAGLAAAQVAAFWPSAPNRAIADRLLGGLRPLERLAARQGDAVGLKSIVLARLLSGRASRAGWRSLPRQVWAHPGVVEQETAPGRSWPARRIAHVLRALLR